MAAPASAAAAMRGWSNQNYYKANPGAVAKSAAD